MTIALSRAAPPAPPTEDAPQDTAPVDPAAYASRYQLPQLVQHAATAESNLAAAHAQATGGHITPPPSPPLPPGVVYDNPQTQAWTRCVGQPAQYGTTAGADTPGVELMSAKMFSPSGTAQQRIPLAGISPETALGQPVPPLTPTRLRDSDMEYSS